MIMIVDDKNLIHMPSVKTNIIRRSNKLYTLIKKNEIKKKNLFTLLFYFFVTLSKSRYLKHSSTVIARGRLCRLIILSSNLTLYTAV